MANVLSFELNKTADWRVRKAERHFNDPRNEAAAQLLRKLAAESTTDSAAAERYESIFEEIVPQKFSDIHSELLGGIGFRWIPSSADDVLKALLVELEEVAAAEKAAETKAREDRLRRALRKSGYSLGKTPARHKSREVHGVGYMVTECERNVCVLGSANWPYDASLDEVEKFAARAS